MSDVEKTAEYSKEQVGVSPDPSRVWKRIQKYEGQWTSEGWVFTRSLYLSFLQLSELPLIASVGGYNFACRANQLTSLKGCPAKVCDFSCGENLLTSLEGGPVEVTGNYYCDNNQLRTLKGAPKETGGYFSCDDNHLTSLHFAPTIDPESTFYCIRNYLSQDTIDDFKQRSQISRMSSKEQYPLADLPTDPVEEPLDIQEEPKAQERPYGDLHPSEIQWSSIESTGSRGFPMWNGVPKKVLSSPKPIEEPKGPRCTTGDLNGIMVQERKKHLVVTVHLESNVSATEVQKLQNKLEQVAFDSGIAVGVGVQK